MNELEQLEAWKKGEGAMVVLFLGWMDRQGYSVTTTRGGQLPSGLSDALLADFLGLARQEVFDQEQEQFQQRLQQVRSKAQNPDYPIQRHDYGPYATDVPAEVPYGVKEWPHGKPGAPEAKLPDSLGVDGDGRIYATGLPGVIPTRIRRGG